MQSNFGDNKYEIQLKDARSFDATHDEGLITSGCLVFVYGAGTKTLATIYADGARTALANPITRAQFASDQGIKFFGAASSYDLLINDDKGNTASHLAVTPSVHLLPVNRSGVDKCLIFPMIFNSGGTEVDTGLDLPLDSLVYDARVEVVTVDSTETVDIGLLSTETAGDADGLVTAASVGTAGYPDMITATAGGNETYLSAVHYGALLGSFLAGSDVAGDVGTFLPKGKVVTGANAKSITYTPSTSDTFAGYGYVYFKLVR
jgi:hypothetical protein